MFIFRFRLSLFFVCFKKAKRIINYLTALSSTQGLEKRAEVTITTKLHKANDLK